MLDPRENTPFVASRLQEEKRQIFLVTLDGEPQGFAETREKARFYALALAEHLRSRLRETAPANEQKIDLQKQTVNVSEIRKGFIFEGRRESVHRISFSTISLLDVNTMKVVQKGP